MSRRLKRGHKEEKMETARSNRKAFRFSGVSRTVFATTNIPTLDFLINFHVTETKWVASRSKHSIWLFLHLDNRWRVGWKRFHNPRQFQIRVEYETTLRAANFSFFASLSTAATHVFIELYGFIAIRDFSFWRGKRFLEWRLASDEWSGLPFHSFRRRGNGFK